MLTEQTAPEPSESKPKNEPTNVIPVKLVPIQQKSIYFRYTIIHDFESLLWMALWGVLHNVTFNTPLTTERAKLIEQLKITAMLFPRVGVTLPINRFSVIMIPEVLKGYLYSLPGPL